MSARDASPVAAIIKFFLYSGARIGTACRLQVKDLHQDGDEATVTLHEKGDKHRRIGLHFAAAEAISAYIAKAELTKGPLFRARLNSRSKKFGRSPIGAVTMYNLVQSYLARLPGSTREEEVTGEDGTVTKVKRCIYTPHSLARPRRRCSSMLGWTSSRSRNCSATGT